MHLNNDQVMPQQAQETNEQLQQEIAKLGSEIPVLGKSPKPVMFKSVS